MMRRVFLVLAVLLVAGSLFGQNISIGVEIPAIGLTQEDELSDDVGSRTFIVSTFVTGGFIVLDTGFIELKGGYLTTLGEAALGDELEILGSVDTIEGELDATWGYAAGGIVAKLPINVSDEVALAPFLGATYWQNVIFENRDANVSRDDLDDQAIEDLNELFIEFGFGLAYTGNTNTSIRAKFFLGFNALASEEFYADQGEALNLNYDASDFMAGVSVGFGFGF